MIYYLIGKSCSGKDTIYKALLEKYKGKLKSLALYTTRPIRSNEREGQEYHFVDERAYEDYKAQGRILEERSYNTVHGLWRYFTLWDEQLRGDEDILMIGVLSSFVAVRDALGQDMVKPIYIELDDGIRLKRALEREMRQEEPKYRELCRRYLADDEDFSQDKIKAAGIEKKFYNDDLEDCIAGIGEYIDGHKGTAAAAGAADCSGDKCTAD